MNKILAKLRLKPTRYHARFPAVELRCWMLDEGYLKQQAFAIIYKILYLPW